MKLIVGLGNPGDEYAQTRHNVGFMALDRLAQRHDITGAKRKFHAGILKGRIGSDKVVLMQPMTYMNRSGMAVGEAARFYKITPENIIIVVDDTAIDVGVIRIRPTGTAGGHNGLSDIHRALGTWNYPRLRVGIGKPQANGHPIPQKDYVLGKFTEEQMQKLDDVFNQTCNAIECWIDHDINTAMNRWNTPRDTKKKSQDNVSSDTPKQQSQNTNNS